MKKTKKIFALVLTVILCMSLLTVAAFAQSTEQDGLKLTLTTDKAEYTDGEQILVKLEAENFSEFAFSNVVLEIQAPNGLSVVTGVAKKTLETLSAGASETLEVAYQVESSPGTGDPISIMMIVAVMVASAAAVLLCINRRTRCMALALVMVFGFACMGMPASAATEAYNTTVSTTVKVNGADMNLTATAAWEVEVVEQPSPEPDSDAIIDLRTEAGASAVSLVWGDPHQLAFDTEVKHGDDAGSLKITKVVDEQGWNYLRLATPAVTDVSAYEFIEFYVYNNTSGDFVVGLLWCGDTTCKAGEWTQVRFPVSLLVNNTVTDMAGKRIEATNITGMDMIFYSGTVLNGESFYISSIRGIAPEEPAPEADPNAIIDLSSEAGFSNVGLVWGDPHQMSFDTQIKHGNDAGSIKITKVVDEQGWNYFRLVNPSITDISEYAFIEFYVYNNTAADFVFGLLWCGDTTCKVGEWTQVRFPVSLLVNNTVTDMAGKRIEATNITGLDMIFYSGAVLNGESFYISSIRAVPAETPAPSSNKVADMNTDAGLNQVSLFWGDPHKLSYNTEFKHGDDAGSLAVTMVVDSQGWNYLLLSAPAIADISQYEYIEFYVYNNTSAAFVIGLTWCGDTTCNPGEWTQVRFATSLFTDGKVTDMASAVMNAGNIAGLPLVFYSSGTVNGESFYISSITVH